MDFKLRSKNVWQRTACSDIMAIRAGGARVIARQRFGCKATLAE